VAGKRIIIEANRGIRVEITTGGDMTLNTGSIFANISLSLCEDTLEVRRKPLLSQVGTKNSYSELSPNYVEGSTISPYLYKIWTMVLICVVAIISTNYYLPKDKFMIPVLLVSLIFLVIGIVLLVKTKKYTRIMTKQGIAVCEIVIARSKSNEVSAFLCELASRINRCRSSAS
jgi:hypothetical protein